MDDGEDASLRVCETSDARKRDWEVYVVFKLGCLQSEYGWEEIRKRTGETGWKYSSLDSWRKLALKSCGLLYDV